MTIAGLEEAEASWSLAPRRVAVVTGGVRGIGLGIVRALLTSGHLVVVGDIDPETPAALERELPEHTESFRGVPTDIRHGEQVDRLFELAVEHFGQVDIAVANAGRMSTPRLSSITTHEWDDVLGTNLRGTLLTCQAAAARMRSGGRIITIASNAIYDPGSVTGIAYSVSKAGIAYMTKVMANDLRASGITVNCIAPGVVRTEMSQVFGEQYLSEAEDRLLHGRLVTADDVGHAVLYLSSPTTTYLTGQVIDARG